MNTPFSLIKYLISLVELLKNINFVDQITIGELTNEVIQLKNQLVLVNAQRATAEMNIERHSKSSSEEFHAVLRTKEEQIHELVR